jgi:ferredoxin
MAHVARSREAGLFHLIGRNRLDTVWLGVGPGEKLLTVCNCCTCCCIWRMLPHVADSVSANVSRMPGVTVAVTGDCTGCAMCEEVCFTGAARVTGGVATIGAACRGCGRCAEVCPESAITVHIDGVDSIDLSIESIAPTVDIS